MVSPGAHCSTDQPASTLKLFGLVLGRPTAIRRLSVRAVQGNRGRRGVGTSHDRCRGWGVWDPTSMLYNKARTCGSVRVSVAASGAALGSISAVVASASLRSRLPLR
jgi:hypothetical protein